MNRTQKILRHVNKNGYGLEIGPSHNPIAPKRAGFKVDIIDHMSREDLIQKYTGHGVNLDSIEEVDYVWQGESYAELTGKTDYYDWIIASHVIEHVPDMITFLNECAQLLKADGVLSLVIPDKRYCFDHYRPITGIAKIIDNHFQGSIRPSPGNVAEFYLNAITQGGTIAWDANLSGAKSFCHSVEEATDLMNRARQTDEYFDVHVSCFVPHSFRLILHDLFALGLTSLKEVDFYPTAGCEFYITLSQSGAGVNLSRFELQEQIAAELRAGKAGFAEQLPTFDPTAPFDEDFYLAQYPDVKAAVEAGSISDGYAHYRTHGWKEGRQGAPSAVTA